MNHLTFLMGMLVFILALSGSASVGAAANEPTALLVMTRRGGDAEQFKARLSQQGFTMLREARCLRYGYSILEVQPNAGTARAALATLKSFKDADLVAAELKFDSVFSGCTPDINDPDYDAQWHLQAMNLEEMHCLLDAQGVTQSVQPRITLIDSGITAIKKELNRNQIREFDFVGGVNGVEESVLIDGASNQHGTAVTSVAAATTN
ncbi:MAG TPA: hypothetical protein PK869_12370, partial [Candidatus Hydrogenedentes bacterium]|nr:hypothetical protein [Candidatus Hydrogenedentota bacterium]